MRFSPGCGCCCVDLTVTGGDNTDKWERTDVSGVTTVTILVPIDICNFRFSFEGEQPDPNPNPPADYSFDGTAKIYFLEDPSDDDVDAIGVITYTNENALDYNGTPGLYYDKNISYFYWEDWQTWGCNSSPFNVDHSTRTYGTVEIDVDDWGMGTPVTANHARTNFDGLQIETFADSVMIETAGIVTQSIWWKGGPTVANVESLGATRLVLDRPSCSAQRVYIRYQTSGDCTATDTSFTLQSVNDPGDEECVNADPQAEDGNCLSPTDSCNVLEARKPLWLKARLQITNWDGYGNNIDEEMWCIGGYIFLDGFCKATQQGLNVCDPYGSNSIYRIAAELTCDSGDVILTIEADGGEWEIDLADSITDPVDIPNTVLNDANSLTSPNNASTTITIN
ncbi:hypothetical protein [Planctomycetes bacterium TBK1r]|uniref:Uncharacterized protein n=1 Tax=Stieleria magnilauensis TaxID=2527963 RepID=A0ABX5XYB4_9BACT|nr:hypothetical protein TBK1r_59380 [Planctomycetes bacterium TBK1r]QDV86989.1 hypothetical protein TBK1r_60160 [Planctomycetes bacterium TBK1r]